MSDDIIEPQNLEKPVTQDVETVNSITDWLPANEFEERKMVGFVMGKYKKWANDRREIESNWETYYNNYRQILPQGHKWRSKVFDPSTFQQVESILPRIMSALFPEPDFFSIEARNPEDIESEESIKVLMEHQLRRAKVPEKFVEIIKQALIYGTTFAKVPFREEYGLRRDKIVEFREEENPITLKKRRVKRRKRIATERVRTFYGPDIEPVDIFDIFADAFDPDLSELIHVTRRPMSYLRDRAAEGVFMNVEKVKPTRGREGDDAKSTGLFRQHDKTVVSEDDEVTLREYWGMYDVEGDGMPEPVMFVIANDSVLLKAEANPFWHGLPPFIFSQFIPVPKELYGIGIPESIASLQKQVNDIINQRNDNVSLIINRMWLVSSLIDIDLKRLASVPGRFILASDIDGVKPLDTPDVTASSYNEVGSLKNQIEQATGFSRFASGLEQGKTTPRAARTVMTMASASLEKFGMTIKFLEQNLVVPTLEMFLQLDQQFLDDIEYLRVTNSEKPEVFEIDPNTLRGDYTFRALGSTEVINKEQQVQGHMTFLATVQNDPSIDRRPIFNKIWKLLGNRDPLPEVQSPLGPTGGDDSQGNQLRTSGTIQNTGLSIPVPRTG